MKRRGFTIVELLVTIGVIVLLTGLTVSALGTLGERADRIRTQSALDLLDLASTTWEHEAERRLTQGLPQDGRFDLDLNTQFTFVISEALRVYERNATTEAILTKIDPRLLIRYEGGGTYPWIDQPQELAALPAFVGTLTVVDAWDQPIYATHPGPVHAPSLASFVRNADGTVRTLNELKYGSALQRRMRFVSSGPDRRFGYLGLPAYTLEYQETLDNLFSYPLDPEEAGGT